MRKITGLLFTANEFCSSFLNILNTMIRARFRFEDCLFLANFVSEKKENSNNNQLQKDALQKLQNISFDFLNEEYSRIKAIEILLLNWISI